MPGYALAVGKGGPRLKETSAAEMTAPPRGERPKTTMDEDGFVLVSPGYPKDDGVFSFRNGDALFSTEGGKASMGQLARELTRDLGQPVSDATGLKGEYDFVMYWALDVPEAATSGAPLPTLSAALQKIGLRLERGKVPIDVLVIDHIEKVPTEN